MKTIFIFLLSTILCLNLVNAKNIFVDPVNGNDINNGTTWELAVRTLSGAVTVANTNFSDGDNIYVKGGTLIISSAFTTAPTANYYGGCAGDEVNISQSIVPSRPLIDIDGNGIVEPWEYQYPTILKATLDYSGTSNVKIFTISNSSYTFNGFTLTHIGSSTSTGLLKSFDIAVSVVFSNNTIKNCIVNTGLGSGDPYDFFFRSLGVITNCLFEKNNVTYNSSSSDQKIYPFISINGGTAKSIFANCIVRNNLLTMNWNAPTNANIRGFLISAPASTTGPVLKNCIIHNNEIVYNSTTAPGPKAGVAATVQMYFSTSSKDSIYNCTIANNKATNITNAGLSFYQSSSAGATHYCVNNVCWGNYSGTTLSNIYSGSSTNTVYGLYRNNFTDGAGLTNNSTTIVNNDNTVSIANNSGTNSPNFKASSSLIGSSLWSLFESDSTAIQQTDWNLLPGSYLKAQGITVGSNFTDKSGNVFSSTPSVGAYEFVESTATLTPQNYLDNFYVNDNKLMLTNLEIGVNLKLYNVSGVMIKTCKIKEENMSIELNPGVYFVCIGSSAQKIIVN